MLRSPVAVYCKEIARFGNFYRLETGSNVSGKPCVPFHYLCCKLLSRVDWISGRILALRRLKPAGAEGVAEVIATFSADIPSLESKADTAKCSKIVVDDVGRRAALVARFAGDSADVAAAVAETFRGSIYRARRRSRCEIPVAFPPRFRWCIDDDEQIFRSTSRVILTTQYIQVRNIETILFFL